MGSRTKKAWLTRDATKHPSGIYDVWGDTPLYDKCFSKWRGPDHIDTISSRVVPAWGWMAGGPDAIIAVEIESKLYGDGDFISIVGKWNGV